MVEEDESTMATEDERASETSDGATERTNAHAAPAAAGSLAREKTGRDMMAAPILARLEQTCARIGEVIAHRLEQVREEHPELPKIGFALLIFDTGDESGWMTYMSNAERKDMLDALVEFIEKHGRRAVAGKEIEALIAEVDGVDNGKCMHCHGYRYHDLEGGTKRCENSDCWSNRVREALRL
jgi:hypothetical protein